MTIPNYKGRLWLVVGLAAVVAGIVSITGATVAADDDSVYTIVSTDYAGGDTAYLGVQLREETEYAEGGARVTSVVGDSPADEAGIREDDIIVLFGDDLIRGPLALTQRIHAMEPGDSIAVTVMRDGEKRRLDVELGQRPDPFGMARMKLENVYTLPDDGKWKEALEDYQERMGELGERLGKQYSDWSVQAAPLSTWRFMGGKPKLGVQLVESTPELRSHLGGDEDEGVLVSKVLPDTPAERAGISVGDLIVDVDGESVASTGDLVKALHDKAGETFPVGIIRDRRKIAVEVTIEEPDDSVPTGPRAFLMRAPRVPRDVPPSAIPAPPAIPAPVVPAPLAAPAPPAPPLHVISRATSSV